MNQAKFCVQASRRVLYPPSRPEGALQRNPGFGSSPTTNISSPHGALKSVAAGATTSVYESNWSHKNVASSAPLHSVGCFVLAARPRPQARQLVSASLVPGRLRAHWLRPGSGRLRVSLRLIHDGSGPVRVLRVEDEAIAEVANAIKHHRQLDGSTASKREQLQRGRDNLSQARFPNSPGRIGVS
ncbi:unnamed protein product [Protopolystoma xenopodis]|uniref:Uncharacterized protein n=1 Tax=Protopolystoma xenopodis TaxID=117903 RepID=A0A448X1X3_9PLAT|nr:unnamed protein product [Protopolystoma xenopodis]